MNEIPELECYPVNECLMKFRSRAIFEEYPSVHALRVISPQLIRQLNLNDDVIKIIIHYLIEIENTTQRIYSINIKHLNWRCDYNIIIANCLLCKIEYVALILIFFNDSDDCHHITVFPFYNMDLSYDSGHIMIHNIFGNAYLVPNGIRKIRSLKIQQEEEEEKNEN
jgi:hypothetical protein